MLSRAICPVLIGLAAVLVVAPAANPAPGLTGFPFTDEDLNYSVQWPSGLSLGEAHLHSRHSGANWSFQFTVDAGIPGYQVKDSYKSEASPDFCSGSFDFTTSHGAKQASEHDTIAGTTLTRGNGGSLSVPACVKDALTMLYFTRRELGQGRVPQAQQIVFGKLFNVSLNYAGAQTIQVGEKQAETDRVDCTVSGSVSYRFEMYFARDAARTPLLVKAPFAVGTFSMELVH